MNSSEFNEIVHEQIKKYKTSDRNESANFLIWFLENIFSLDKDDAMSCVCDAKNDKGIDGIYVDVNEEEIHVFQTKLKKDDNATIGDAIIREFCGVKEWFRNSTTMNNLLNQTINPELKALIIDNKLSDIIDDYNIQFHFIINAKNDYNTIEFKSVLEDVVVWDIDTLIQRLHLIKDTPFVEHEKEFLNIQNYDKIEIGLQNSVKMIVFYTTASEITRLKGIDDYTLFSRNVRYGLGNTRVNKSIKETLNDSNEKGKFILFHNGISIVCEKCYHDNNNSKIVIKNYSIVNGAQSTLTFYNNQTILNDTVKVLVRAIEVGTNSELANAISFYNNNQNSISMRDLRSTDKTQKRLVKEIESINNEYSIKYQYIPKRGENLKSGYFYINSDLAAQLITSAYSQKSYITHKKTELFDNDYSDIFNKNIDGGKIILYFNIFQCILNNICKIADKGVALYGIAQYFLVSIIVKIMKNSVSTEIIFRESIKYFKNYDKYNALIDMIFNIVVGIFNHLLCTEKENNDFVYKNYFKSKEKVEELSKNISALFDTSLKITNISYDDICKKAGL